MIDLTPLTVLIPMVAFFLCSAGADGVTREQLELFQDQRQFRVHPRIHGWRHFKLSSERQYNQKSSDVRMTFDTSVSADNVPLQSLSDENRESFSVLSQERKRRAIASDDAVVMPTTLPEPGTHSDNTRIVRRRKGRRKRRRKCKTLFLKSKLKKKWKNKMKKRNQYTKNDGQNVRGRRRQTRNRKGKRRNMRRKCRKMIKRKLKRKNWRKNRKGRGQFEKNMDTSVGPDINYSKKTTTATISLDISSETSEPATKGVDLHTYTSNNPLTTSEKDISGTDQEKSEISTTTGHFGNPETESQEDVDLDLEGKMVNPKGENDLAKNIDVESSQVEMFDVLKIAQLFRDAIDQDSQGLNIVTMEGYIRAYRKLVNVFQFFGPFLSIARYEVDDKLGILTRLRQESHNETGPGTGTGNQLPKNYENFRSMFEYEFDIGVALPGQPGTSGVRENAWIHRPLKFILSIIKALIDQSDTRPLSGKVKMFYTDILAPYHAWIVRMGVYAAISTFPSRETLMARMNVPDDAEGIRKLTEMAESIQNVYDIIQDHYETFSPPQPVVD